MIARLLLAAALLSASAHAADFERTLTVPAGVDLYVATGSGRIHVSPGSDSQMHIKAHVYAGWNMGGGETDGRITKIVEHPPIEQSGNAVHIGEVESSLRRLYNNITVDYEITAPRGTALNLRSGSGDVEVDDLGRYLKGQTGSGSIRARGIGGAAELQTGSGDIELTQSGHGDVRASTGSGSIRVRGLAGGLVARTGSGDIEADGNLTGAARLQSGSGSIRMRIGHEAHYNLDASTGSGSIRVPGNYKSDAHHLSMPINGGGPLLEAHTGSGDIEVD